MNKATLAGSPINLKYFAAWSDGPGIQCKDAYFFCIVAGYPSNSEISFLKIIYNIHEYWCIFLSSNCLKDILKYQKVSNSLWIWKSMLYVIRQCSSIFNGNLRVYWMYPGCLPSLKSTLTDCSRLWFPLYLATYSVINSLSHVNCCSVTAFIKREVINVELYLPVLYFQRTSLFSHFVLNLNDRNSV